MSAKKRADLVTKLHKFVKKQYPVVSPPSNRSVLEHMIYGCCLENSTFEAADEALAKLQENYFDWNEVRVTTTAELAEPCKNLSNPKEAAASVKKTLHGVFESYYQFDLDFLRKENLSKSIQTFQKFNGVSPFVISYVAQNGLGGHSIPIDRSMMSLFYVLGVVTEDEAIKGRVPGLERTIAKAKGTEFFALTHPLAVAYASAPFSSAIREKILKINPAAKDRFPKRGGKKKAVPAKAAKPEGKKKVKQVTKKSKTAAKSKVVAKSKATKKKTSKKPAAKPVKKSKTKKVSAKSAKKTTKRPAAKRKSPSKRLSKKKPR